MLDDDNSEHSSVASDGEDVNEDDSPDKIKKAGETSLRTSNANADNSTPLTAP